MVSAWYMDDSDEDQRLDHQKNPPQPVDMKDVITLTGVLHWKVYCNVLHQLLNYFLDINFCLFIQLNLDTYEEDGVLDKIKKDRGYSYEDVIEISPEKLPNYEEKVCISIFNNLNSIDYFYL